MGDSNILNDGLIQYSKLIERTISMDLIKKKKKKITLITAELIGRENFMSWTRIIML